MNWQSILVAVIIAVVFAAIVFMAVRNKKKGKSACSCVGGCANCAHSEFCHR